MASRHRVHRLRIVAERPKSAFPDFPRFLGPKSQIRPSARNRPRRDLIAAGASAQDGPLGLPESRPPSSAETPSETADGDVKRGGPRLFILLQVVAGAPKSEFPDFPNFFREIANPPVAPKSTAAWADRPRNLGYGWPTWTLEFRTPLSADSDGGKTPSTTADGDVEKRPKSPRQRPTAAGANAASRSRPNFRISRFVQEYWKFPGRPDTGRSAIESLPNPRPRLARPGPRILRPIFG